MNGKTVVITGASSGIGFGVAEAYVGQGANVVLNGRDEAKLTEAAFVTDQPTAVSMARSLIEDLKENGKVVDRAFITRICKLPVTKATYQANVKRRRTRDITSRTWLVGLKPIMARDDEQSAIEDGQIEAEKHLSDEESESSWIRFRGNSRFRREAKRGDNVICI